MAIKPGKRGKWEIDIHMGSALPGYNRIRRTVPTQEEAEALHREVEAHLKVYGKWPIDEYDRPIERAKANKTGTLREAAKLALEFHWHGTAYGETVEKIIWPVIEWMEENGCPNIDDITSYHLDKFIAARRERGNSNETINKYLSILSVLNKMGRDRKPPLCKSTIPFKRLKVAPVEKWWLQPQEMEKLCDWLDKRGDSMFSDYIRFVCFQGLRAEEALRLTPRNFLDINGDKPRIDVPGRKTKDSRAAIPLFDTALPTVKACIERAQRNGWKFIFPITLRQAQTRWNECRAYLGATDQPTATLKSLRRTFAAYANERGMPTATLQKVMRHSSIVTTEGYLNLVGSSSMENARDYMGEGRRAEQGMAKKDSGLDHSKAIAAYMSTGASPEQVARFVKELMS